MQHITQKKEHLFRCSLVRETGLEPYSVERKSLGNTAFLEACVMICVMSAFYPSLRSMLRWGYLNPFRSLIYFSISIGTLSFIT